jgi:acetyltransferase-like isoleucine patch superfamily enzyme
MAAISPEVKIGKQTIVNTNATIDHETVISDGCHIMPAATIAGCVIIEKFCTIGSNATILPRVKLKMSTTVGAGAVVTKDTVENSIVVGIPAKQIKYSEI